MDDPKWNSNLRVATSLSHGEPDRVPVDLGATGVAGLRVEAQDGLLRYLAIDAVTEEVLNPILRVAAPHEALLERYPADTRPCLWTDGIVAEEDNEGPDRVEWRTESSLARDEDGEDAEPVRSERATDAFGVRWTRSGLSPAFMPQTAPLAGELPIDRLAAYPFPEPDEVIRWPDVPTANTAIVVSGYGQGFVEMACRLRGAPSVMRDMATAGGSTVALMERVLELKCAYWEARLSKGELPDQPSTLLLETERLDLMRGLPIEPDRFRERLLPLWNRVIRMLNRLMPHSTPFLFSPVYDHRILGDLIDIGVLCVNLPAWETFDLNPAALKREYGAALSFWGAGTSGADQFLLGSREEAADQVKLALDTFAPEGGFVWSPWPIVDADVPPANVASALDTLVDYGLY